MKKNIFKIFFLALSVVLLYSCDPDKVDDGFFNDVKVYSQFKSSTLTVPVLDGLDNSQSIFVQVTTPISTAGLSIEVDESSEAVAGVDFNLDKTELVLNDGQIETSIIINPIFETASLDGKTLILNLVSSDDNVIVQGNKQIEISIEKQCPVADDYMIGEYTISDVQAVIGPGNGVSNFTGTVNISMGSSATSRVFDVAFLAGFGTAPATVELSLVCNKLSFNTTNTVPLACDGVNLIGYTPDPDAEMTYSDDDDSSFVINYIEDQNASCGGPFQSSFILTKVN